LTYTSGSIEIQLHWSTNTRIFNSSNQVGQVLEIFQSNKVLLDAPWRDKSIEEVDTASLIVRPTATGTSEWLLTDNSTCTLLVVINVTCGMAQLIGCSDERLAIGRKSEMLSWVTPIRG